MKEQLQGFKKIFAFTFKNQVKQRKFLLTTIIIMLLCFLLPFGGIVFTSSEKNSKKDSSEPPKIKNEMKLEEIYIADNCEEKLNLTGFEEKIEAKIDKDIKFTQIDGELSSKFIKNFKTSKEKLLIIINQVEKSYTVNLITGRRSQMDEKVVNQINEGIEEFTKEYMEIVNPKKDKGDEKTFEDFALAALAYLNVFVLYMFILIYGQTVSGAIVLEKTSKLMETMLISVKPGAMILGKVLAISFSGILQIFSYVIFAYLGFLGGSLFVQITGRTGLNAMAIQDSVVNLLKGYLSPLNLLIALLLIFMGILMYCTISSISGAISSKKEDLAATNGIFALIIVACFLICMFGGGLKSVSPKNAWMDFVPFTSVMVSPARLMLGEIPISTGFISFGLMFVTTLIFAFISGKFYVGLALYKGKVPSPKELIALLKR